MVITKLHTVTGSKQYIASFIFRLWFQKDFNWLSIMTLSIFNPLWCNKLQIIPDAADICGRALVLRLETIHTAVHCASFVLHLASDALFQSKGGYWCSCRLVCNDTVLLDTIVLHLVAQVVARRPVAMLRGLLMLLLAGSLPLKLKKCGELVSQLCDHQPSQIIQAWTNNRRKSMRKDNGWTTVR